MENQNLKQGEKNVVSPGKVGLKVNVFRNEELISTDTYKAVESIIQIGPFTKWDNRSEK
jgi:hypothetical protein